MRRATLFYFCVLPFVFFTSCGVSDAEHVADLYHDKLDAKDYTYIVDNLVDEEILAETGKEAWLGLFDYMDKTWGAIKSRKKETGFNSHYNNGETSVELNYSSEHDLIPVMYERLYLIKKDKDFKLTGILVNESKENLEAAASDF